VDNVYGAVIMTQVIARVHQFVWRMQASARRLPTLRPGQLTCAASPPVGCYMAYIHHRHLLLLSPKADLADTHFTVQQWRRAVQVIKLSGMHSSNGTKHVWKLRCDQTQSYNGYNDNKNPSTHVTRDLSISPTQLTDGGVYVYVENIPGHGVQQIRIAQFIALSNNNNNNNNKDICNALNSPKPQMRSQ